MRVSRNCPCVPAEADRSETFPYILNYSRWQLGGSRGTQLDKHPPLTLRCRSHEITALQVRATEQTLRRRLHRAVLSSYTITASFSTSAAVSGCAATLVLVWAVTCGLGDSRRPRDLLRAITAAASLRMRLRRRLLQCGWGGRGRD